MKKNAELAVRHDPAANGAVNPEAVAGVWEAPAPLDPGAPEAPGGKVAFPEAGESGRPGLASIEETRAGSLAIGVDEKLFALKVAGPS